MASNTSVGSFTSSLTTMLTGTVLAQAIPFLVAPVIARQYTVAEFAVFGSLMAVFNILNVVAAGRYEMAVMVPREDEEAAHLVRGARTISMMTGIVALAVLSVLGTSDRIRTALPGLSTVITYAAMLTLMAGVQVSTQQWLLRKGMFGAVARFKVLQALVITGATIVLGYYHVSFGLERGYLIGWSAFSFATAFWVLTRVPLPGGWSWEGMMGALSRFREWPLVNTWPALINAVASGMATFFVVAYFPLQVSGQHNFARQYLLVPISMVTVALSQVLFARSAGRIREGLPLLPELRSVLKVLVPLGLAGAILLTFLSVPLFSWVFGHQWSEAGAYARWLIWGYVAQLIASPFSVLLLAMRQVRATLVFPMLFMLLLLVVPLFQHLVPMRFMAVLSGVEIIAYGSQLALVFWFAARYDRSLTP
ncbi:MAG: oligosaccharide flippase family protein [Flavobacteriales bacterium]|nr:oligosaccharide flippase family protein [Flavobacteriales bacterium]